MNKILLDTTAYSEFMGGNQEIFEVFAETETIYVSTILIGELYAGFFGGNRYAAHTDELKRFLRKEVVALINVTLETAEIFSEIKAELHAKGKMIPPNDIWIAAHGIETGSKLITFDSHFKEIRACAYGGTARICPNCFSADYSQNLASGLTSKRLLHKPRASVICPYRRSILFVIS